MLPATGQPEGGGEVEKGTTTADGVCWIPPGDRNGDGGQEED